MLHRFVLLLVLFLWGSGLHQVRAQEEARKPLRIDTNHSTLGFSVPIVGGLSQVTGKFTDFDVQIIWDEADPAASSVQATLQVASIDTGIDDRDSDLQSPNFFDVATYPTLTFESDHIEQQGEGFLAHGTLTMKGVSKEVALPFQVRSRSQSDGGTWHAFVVDYTLDRTAYGITWEHSIVPFFVGNDVTVNLFVMTR